MRQTISRLLGLATELDADSEWSFRLADLWDPAWPLLLLLLALVSYYVWQYRQDAQRLTAPRRYLLTSLRIGIVCLVVLMLIRPALNIANTEKRTPVVAVLVDESLSMAYPDARNHPFLPAAGQREERSRFAVAREATNRLLGPLGLNNHHRVVVYKFSGTVERVRRGGRPRARENAGEGDEEIRTGLDRADRHPLQPRGRTRGCLARSGRHQGLRHGPDLRRPIYGNAAIRRTDAG